MRFRAYRGSTDRWYVEDTFTIDLVAGPFNQKQAELTARLLSHGRIQPPLSVPDGII